MDEQEKLHQMRVQLDTITNVTELVEFASFYVLVRNRTPILKRGDDNIFVAYLQRAQDWAQLMYCELQAGRLSRNAVITALAPVAEIRTRAQLRCFHKGDRHEDANDAEGVANLALCEAVDKAKDGIRNFGGYITVRIDNALKNFVTKENNFRRFIDDMTKDCTWKKDFDMADFHGNDGVKQIDATDELEHLAHDETDLAIVRLRAQGFKNNEIAKELGLSTAGVSLRCRKMEGRLDEKLLIVGEDSVDEHIVNGRLAGKSDKTIAKTCGINTATVTTRIRTLERRLIEREEQLHILLA